MSNESCHVRKGSNATTRERRKPGKGASLPCCNNNASDFGVSREKNTHGGKKNSTTLGEWHERKENSDKEDKTRQSSTKQPSGLCFSFFNTERKNS